jgi:hypothetical protein
MGRENTEKTEIMEETESLQTRFTGLVRIGQKDYLTPLLLPS